MSVQVSLNFSDFNAARDFFASVRAAAPIVSQDVKPVAAVQPTEVSPPVAAPPAEAKKSRKPRPEAAPAPAAPVPPLDVKSGDPLPANMQPEPAATKVDPLEVPAFLDRREPKPLLTPEEAVKVWTIDEVREELRKVSEKHGIDAVRDIVATAGGTLRISEVPAEKFKAVVEAARLKLVPQT